MRWILMVAMALCLTGCSILYTAKFESKDRTIEEFGLFGGPGRTNPPGGLLPLYRTTTTEQDRVQQPAAM